MKSNFSDWITNTLNSDVKVFFRKTAILIMLTMLLTGYTKWRNVYLGLAPWGTTWVRRKRLFPHSSTHHSLSNDWTKRERIQYERKSSTSFNRCFSIHSWWLRRRSQRTWWRVLLGCSVMKYRFSSLLIKVSYALTIFIEQLKTGVFCL